MSDAVCPSDRTIGQPAAVCNGGRALGDSAMKGTAMRGPGTGLDAPHLESEACLEIQRSGLLNRGHVRLSLAAAAARNQPGSRLDIAPVPRGRHTAGGGVNPPQALGRGPEPLHQSQPTRQLVPTLDGQVHQLQIVDSKPLNPGTHTVSRTTLAFIGPHCFRAGRGRRASRGRA